MKKIVIIVLSMLAASLPAFAQLSLEREEKPEVLAYAGNPFPFISLTGAESIRVSRLPCDTAEVYVFVIDYGEEYGEVATRSETDGVAISTGVPVKDIMLYLGSTYGEARESLERLLALYDAEKGESYVTLTYPDGEKVRVVPDIYIRKKKRAWSDRIIVFHPEYHGRTEIRYTTFRKFVKQFEENGEVKH